MVDRPVRVSSDAGDFDVGLIYAPPGLQPLDGTAERVGQQRCEALHSAEQCDVIAMTPRVGEQVFDVAVPQSVAEVPSHRHVIASAVGIEDC